MIDFCPGLFTSLEALPKAPRMHIVAFSWMRARSLNPQRPMADAMSLAGFFKSTCMVHYVDASLMTPLPVKGVKTPPGSKCRTVSEWATFARSVMAAATNKPVLSGLSATDSESFAAFYSCTDPVVAAEMAKKRGFQR